MTNPDDWNPRDSDVLADQRRSYDDMRERCPVAHSGAMNWSIFRHEDVNAVLMDPDVFSNSSRHHAIPNAMNGREHTIHRQLLEPYFSDARMAAIEPQCRAIAAEAARSLIGNDGVDAIASFAEPASIKMMCRFLGWPLDTWQRVRDWIHGNQQATFARDRVAAAALADEYTAIVMDALDARRRSPAAQDDVTSQLMATHVDGKPWTDVDIVDTLRNWIAGHGTVSAAIGIVLFHLADDQDLQRRLRAEPEVIPAAVDEILRSDGPLVSNRRTATRDVTISGRNISSGERLSLMWIAANRDPRAFDDPSTIEPGRNTEDNLLYGAGIHYCLGAPLARLEMRVAVEVLFDHTVGFSLVPDTTPGRDPYPSNGLTTLPIRTR